MDNSYSPIEDRQTFLNRDMVLKVRPADPDVWDSTPYEPFIDALCGYRDYQKRAIKITLDYLLGRRYGSLRDLAFENFDQSSELQRRWGRKAEFERHLQMPDQLSCSLDLATGTGKSYVIYGIAMILLAEGAVDRVLVLCPSTTIESGLLGKFRELASLARLQEMLPVGSRIRLPAISNANETVVAGSICVENYHSVFDHVGSSIEDSFKGASGKTVVFSDEVHHVVNEANRSAKLWKLFLTSNDYAFSYLVGLSGTTYVGDSYFTDVVYRYSLREAIEANIVKRVDYVVDGPVVSNQREKWQLVWQKHHNIKEQLQHRGIRPLSIIVADSVATARRVYGDLTEWLAEWEQTDEDVAAGKVLIVTSHKDHRANVAALRNVDLPSSRTEWIVSVSMLSEGWDVKNVFQIVPHEERAFRSKLLISQVLGRGLRRPEGWDGDHPVVSIFNHDSWSKRIQSVINEVLEIERRVTSLPLTQSKFNFNLHNIRYSRNPETTDYEKVGEYNLFDKGYVVLPTQVVDRAVAVIYQEAVSGRSTKFETSLTERTTTAEHVASELFLRLRGFDQETSVDPVTENRTDYADRFPLERCLGIVRESLRRAGVSEDRVTEDNRQRLLQAIGPLGRKASKRIVYALSADALETVETRNRPADSCSASDLRRASKSIFYTLDTASAVRDHEKDFFGEIIDEYGDFTGASILVPNDADYRTPVSFTIADAGPEKRFLGFLVQRENARHIDAWLKNTSTGFYLIEYSWKKGEHSKRGEFNPDFFLKIGQAIHIIEIKHDDEAADPAPENVKKHEFATSHVACLNDLLKKQGSAERYYFNMLRPKDYPAFFQKMRSSELQSYTSTLDAAMINS